jgi:hypothetical protein
MSSFRRVEAAPWGLVETLGRRSRGTSKHRLLGSRCENSIVSTHVADAPAEVLTPWATSAVVVTANHARDFPALAGAIWLARVIASLDRMYKKLR